MTDLSERSDVLPESTAFQALDSVLDEVLAPGRSFMFLDQEYTTFSQARVVVVPVPFDGTTCYRPGTREGPQAIIDASRNLELYDTELRRAPYRVGIHTLRPVEIVMGNAQAMVDRTELVTQRLLDHGKFVVTLGGDHLTSIGVIRAFAKRYPAMSVLQLDAHGDLRDEYEGSRLSSATIMRRTLEVCPRTAQVGIRSLSEPEAHLVEERKLPLWLASDIHAQAVRGAHDWLDEVVATLGDEVYVTVDIDAFDPSLVPGTGTPEPGGLGWYEVIDLLTAVAARKRVIGFDVVEVSPLVESHVSPVVAAKLVYKLIGLAVK
ncbi:MAG TPA: agmatinase [Ktedonobacterales bacterium]|nr:agmatinase [Ktedonobacterales bacterium]